jgi:predicted transcriptional regulator
MNEIILSIKPKFSDAIYSKQKTIELRRKIGVQFRKRGTIYIYTSCPVKQISGEAKILRIENLPVDEIKKHYLAEACISTHDFDSYFVGCTHGYLIFLCDVMEYKNKISLKKLSLLNFKPPQSFCYPNSLLLNFIEAEKCT